MPVGLPSALSSGVPDWDRRTRWPFVPTVFAPALMLETRTLPDLGNTAVTLPVSTTISSPESLTWMPLARRARRGADELPLLVAVMVYSSAGDSLAPRACPVHFRLPSGQYAVTHDWRLASPVVVNVVALAGCCPRGQGTPNVVPERYFGVPSIHRTLTELLCAHAKLKRPARPIMAALTILGLRRKNTTRPYSQRGNLTSWQSTTDGEQFVPASSARLPSLSCCIFERIPGRPCRFWQLNRLAVSHARSCAYNVILTAPRTA